MKGKASGWYVKFTCKIGNARNQPHNDVMKWKHFPRYWPFVWGIHRWPVNSPHKGQWRGALMFSLIYAWIDGWVNTHETGDLRRHRAHYDVSVMKRKCMNHTQLDTAGTKVLRLLFNTSGNNEKCQVPQITTCKLIVQIYKESCRPFHSIPHSIPFHRIEENRTEQNEIEQNRIEFISGRMYNK